MVNGRTSKSKKLEVSMAADIDTTSTRLVAGRMTAMYRGRRLSTKMSAKSQCGGTHNTDWFITQLI